MAKRVNKNGNLIIIFFVLFFVNLSSFAQSSQKITCQAIIRDATNFLVIDQPVGIRISVLKESSRGLPVYIETIHTTTQSNGSVEIELGNGNKVYGSFANIDWAGDKYIVETEIDPAGGNEYTIKGSCQLLKDSKPLYKEVEPPLAKTIVDSPVIAPKETANILTTETVSVPNGELSITDITKNISCDGENDGSIDITIVGGTPPYSYLWNMGSLSEDLTNLSAGTYEISVKDAEGKIASKQFLIEESSKLFCSAISVPETEARNDGKIKLSIAGGTGLYSFVWSNKAISQNLSGLSAGKYSVTVSDLGGCSCTTEVEVKSDIYILAETTNVSCVGASNGEINLTVGGGEPPYTLLWKNGSSAEKQSNLASGNYQVKVVDNAGNEKEKTYSISEPSPIIINDSITPSNGKDGSIDITVTGGVMPYSFYWSNGARTEDIENLEGDIYTVTVKDYNNCSQQKSIVDPGPFKIKETIVHNVCYSDNQGSISIEANGFDAPYTYEWSFPEWSNSISTKDISYLKSGTYHLKVTDNKGTISEKDITVLPLNPIELSFSKIIDTIQGGQRINIDLKVSGGHGGYQYNWSNGATTEDLINILGGVYNVTVTDSAGCVSTGSIEVLLIESDYFILSDYDNNTYKTVKIGNQIWMAENLKTTTLNDSTPILLLTDTVEWKATISPAYSWYNNEETKYKNPYGTL